MSTYTNVQELANGIANLPHGQYMLMLEHLAKIGLAVSTEKAEPPERPVPTQAERWATMPAEARRAVELRRRADRGGT